MTVVTTNVGDSAVTPGMGTSVYTPDQLIAGNFKLVTDTVTLNTGVLVRGAVLGQITATGNYIVCVKSAVDGSQVPAAILADNADASGGAVQAPVYLTGEFNTNALTFDATWTAAALKTALRAQDIFLKNAVSAADPT